MKLYLVQHAKALSKEEDPERSLSPAGWKETKRIALFLSEYIKLIVTKIYHSSKTRSVDTAEELEEFLAPHKGIEQLEFLKPNDPIEPFLQKLDKLTENVMVVGHLPYLNKLLNSLLGLPLDSEAVKFCNSGVLCLEKTELHWILLWKFSPEDLLTD